MKKKKEKEKKKTLHKYFLHDSASNFGTLLSISPDQPIAYKYDSTNKIE